jgi:hypothetical protein
MKNSKHELEEYVKYLENVCVQQQLEINCKIL